MKIPKSIQPLIDDGLVDEVIRPLKSGKEAAVYMVLSKGEVCCAKVYKEAHQRSFHAQTQYQEGRKVRNSRQARAMNKRTRYGRKEQETAWQNAEVDALYRLAAAGVRVPQPYGYYDGVLLMELITDSEGQAAPRLNDLEITISQGREYHQKLLVDMVRMLCAGIVHGDLSEYNILIDQDGPVIIDLPQAVAATANNRAGLMFERDVDNVTAYFGRYLPELLTADYGKEIWELYTRGVLNPEVKLTGRPERREKQAHVDGIMQEIDAARDEAIQRQRVLR